MITRRHMLQATAAAGAASGIVAVNRKPPKPVRRLPPARVAVLKARGYEVDFESLVARGLAECGISLRGKRVLLKPNLVEYAPGAPIHAHPAVLAGALAALRAQGAHVVVGEGPGHRRDTIDMARSAGYPNAIPGFDSGFVDLNLDNVRAADLPGLNEPVYLPETALAADVIVSLAKMKTHHWAGATLSMKNLFGVVPGAVYGWPKNRLHFLGIEESIAALYSFFPRVIGIVDGVIGMEGNGPIQGRPVASGVLVVGSDAAATDAVCCRLMGIDPGRIGYLGKVDGRKTNLDSILPAGENVSLLARRFELPRRLRPLAL